MTRRSPGFDAVFRDATAGREPFPFQRRLAAERWPDVVHIPTGLGKTAAVGLAWIHGRLTGDPETPRRLIYCLPMRVLVEQTATEFRGWLENLDMLATSGDEDGIDVSVLMGGEQDLRTASWAGRPEQAQVLIGTQDMLLSRALMRGYGMSRYQWPIHFGLLHTDALWVFDEVQLMGPALATSAQLEAFRRDQAGRNPAPDGDSRRSTRSIWISATLRPEWLGTVDFRSQIDGLKILEVGEEDRAALHERLEAKKRLQPAKVRLDKEGSKGKSKTYLADLADLVIERHVAGTQTLVILNRVDRAQSLAQTLVGAGVADSVLLVHSRFRKRERDSLNQNLREYRTGDRIVVATQAVEAGVDISSRTLITELAPWDSLVQRFGRSNRRGEFKDGSDVLWVDIEDGIDEAAPYEDPELAEARTILESLSSVSPADLPPVDEHRPLSAVLRRRDLDDLFDTDPDLSGFDLDISPYIRDSGSPQVLVFWRDFENTPATDELAPDPSEICAFSMGHIADYLKTKFSDKTRPAWARDSLAGQWTRIRTIREVRPGMTLMLQASKGGYDSKQGADPKGQVAVQAFPPDNGRPAESSEDDSGSQVGRFVRLSEHTANVVRHTKSIAEQLGLGVREAKALVTAALWHDVGKAHPAFQNALLDFADSPSDPGMGPWAKSSGKGRLKYRVEHDGEFEYRKHFRHELASMLTWLEHGEADEADSDLIAYLILAHHGRVRMRLRALPTEIPPEDDRLYARGVHDGDSLPACSLEGLELPDTALRLDLMQLGFGTSGPSWTERSQALLADLGSFRLAWLESLLRIADWRASAEEER